MLGKDQALADAPAALANLEREYEAACAALKTERSRGRGGEPSGNGAPPVSAGSTEGRTGAGVPPRV
jgi:hypothetical protein